LNAEILIDPTLNIFHDFEIATYGEENDQTPCGNGLNSEHRRFCPMLGADDPMKQNEKRVA
jgi:hypothetical protein